MGCEFDNLQSAGRKNLQQELPSGQKKESKMMKKTAILLLFALPLLAFKCAGDSKKEGSGDAIFQEEPGSTAPPPKAQAPATYSDGAGNPPAKTVITDDGSPDSSTTNATTTDEMTDSGFTVGEEKQIAWLITILSKKVNGYGDVTKNLMDRHQCAMFLSSKYRTPLDALNFWGRHRFDRTRKEEVQEQLKTLAAWKIENYDKKKMLRRLEVLKEAWERTKAFEVTMPN
jgi:hypothetical protein